MTDLLAIACRCVVLLGCVAIAGCLHRPALVESERAEYRQADVPASLEKSSSAFLSIEIPDVSAPPTVADPERPPHYLTLNEAIALALEKGNVGSQSLRSPGSANSELSGFAGRNPGGSDSIRVLSLQPARVGTDIEAGLSRFDPTWSSGINWRFTDEPTQGFSSFSNGESANFFSTLAKPLASGGVVGVEFSTDYQLLADPPGGSFSVLNPSYTPRLKIGFEQPLLRGFGVGINQVRPSHPGSSLFPGSTDRGAISEGILIARLRFDQQRAEFERAVNFLILNVHVAYWNLYGAYVSHYVAEQSFRQSHASWTISKELFDGGRIDKAQHAQVLAQYEQFRAERLRATARVLDAERNLRLLLGLAVNDGKRLVPIDEPASVAPLPDWSSALYDAITLRPELTALRQEIQAKLANLDLQKNNLLPDLRFQASHTIVGLGSRLDGNGVFVDGNAEAFTDNALRSLSSTHYNNWSLGFTLNVPLGYRQEHAQVRDARLALTQSYLTLKNQELMAEHALASQFTKLAEFSKLIEIRRQQRLAEGEQVETRFRKYAAGVKDSPIEFLLDAQRQWAIALNQEFQAVVDYNIALVQFEFSRGTIQQMAKVRIADQPIPDLAAVRTVTFERSRVADLHQSELKRGETFAAVSKNHASPAVPTISNLSVVALESLLKKSPTPITHPTATPPLELAKSLTADPPIIEPRPAVPAVRTGVHFGSPQ